MTASSAWSRRSFLRVGGGAIVGAAVLGACSSDDDEPEADAADPTTTTTAAPDDPGTDDPVVDDPNPDGPTSLSAEDFLGLAACLLLPEEVEGPYYLDDDLVRRDLTELLDGHRLRLGLMVVDPDCLPIPGAVVDVWHADVDGDYSGFADGSTGRGDGDGAGGTAFLRGTQVADAEGIVEFTTLYPGWYRGRAVHIHLKVHLEDETVLTTQLVFDDALSDEIFTEPLYAARGERDVRNDDDPLIGDWRENGTRLTTRPDDAGAGTLALALIGVDPTGGAGGADRPLP